MEFSKYKRYGAYHWKWYDSKPSYRQHVDHIKEWIQEKNTLDIGAGDGLIAHVLGIRGVDNEPTAIEVAKRRGMDIDLGDAYDLPYSDGEFEAAYMGDLLEHLEFPQKALNEAKRVIQKFLYIAAPLRRRGCAVVEPEHYREYSEQELQKEVEDAGFLMEEMIVSHNTCYGKFKKV